MRTESREGDGVEPDGRADGGREPENASPWPPAEEARFASLLEELAGAEEEEEVRRLRDELRRLSGAPVEGGVGAWLRWYLREHLGLGRNARAVREAGLAPRDEDECEPAAEEEFVFHHPEYNWCALEKIKNRDDMVKLRQLYFDLETPLRVRGRGPLSFQRLTGLSAAELEAFRGRSLSDAVFDERVQVAMLRTLKDYGKIMMLSAFPSATQRAGAVVYAAAIAQALVRFETKITSLSYQQLAESLDGLLGRPYIVERYRALFQAARARCG